MVQLGNIIEIESSPEPEPRQATPDAKSRDKGKRKATPHRLALASSVIELTDSESEVDDDKSSTTRPVGPSHPNSHTDPGPLSPKRTSIPNLKSNSLRPLNNIPTLPQQNGALTSSFGSEVGSSSAPASGSGSEAGPSKQNPTFAKAHDYNPS